MNLFNYLMAKKGHNTSVRDDLFAYLLGKNQRSSLLPKEYKQVEYIEATGTQYINTGVFPTNNTKIECKSSRGQVMSNGSWIGSLNVRFNSPVTASGNFGYFFSNTVIASGFDYKNYREPNVIKLDKESLIINNTVFPINYNLTNTDTTEILTCGYSPLGETYNSAIMIWYLKIYEDDILIRDFIPCYRKSDKKPGLYDIVNNVFYTNQGTGEFLYG